MVPLLTIPPNVKYVDLFKKLVKEARENDKGLWAEPKDETDDLAVISWEEAGNILAKKL